MLELLTASSDYADMQARARLFIRETGYFQAARLSSPKKQPSTFRGERYQGCLSPADLCPKEVLCEKAKPWVTYSSLPTTNHRTSQYSRLQTRPL
jgi:hypothetical protein